MKTKLTKLEENILCVRLLLGTVVENLQQIVENIFKALVIVSYVHKENKERRS